MKPITTKLKLVAPCPSCGKYEFNLQHILDEAVAKHRTATAGPWRCDSCYSRFNFQVASDGNVFAEQVENKDAFIRSVVLLKTVTKEEPLYFVLLTNSLENDLENQNPKDGTPSNIAYYYNEHTCPINWACKIVGFVHNSDTDPHDAFEFCRAMSINDAKDILLKNEAYDGEFPSGGSDLRRLVGDNSTTLFPETLDPTGGEMLEGEASLVPIAIAYNRRIT